MPEPQRFTYLGPESTFTEQALLTVPESATAIRVPARSVPEAMDAVRGGDADAALVPLENSVEGSVDVTLDELVGGAPLTITREVVLPVVFVLAVRPGTTLDDVRTVASHPHAAAQCRGFLRKTVPDASIVDVLSTAAAAQAVRRGEHDAAICAAIAAERAGLVTLADNIGDHADAVTRFVLVARPAPPPPPTGNDVTSLAVYISHDRVGSLLEVLTQLAVRGINLTRIESRPTGERRLGRYLFFLDCSGHVAEVRMGEAMAGLHRVCAEVKFLGSYPRSTGDGPVPAPPGTTDADFTDAAAWLDRLRRYGTA